MKSYLDTGTLFCQGGMEILGIKRVVQDNMVSDVPMDCPASAWDGDLHCRILILCLQINFSRKNTGCG